MRTRTDPLHEVRKLCVRYLRPYDVDRGFWPIIMVENTEFECWSFLSELGNFAKLRFLAKLLNI